MQDADMDASTWASQALAALLERIAEAIGAEAVLLEECAAKLLARKLP